MPTVPRHLMTAPCHRPAAPDLPEMTLRLGPWLAHPARGRAGLSLARDRQLGRLRAACGRGRLRGYRLMADTPILRFLERPLSGPKLRAGFHPEPKSATSASRPPGCTPPPVEGRARTSDHHRHHDPGERPCAFGSKRSIASRASRSSVSRSSSSQRAPGAPGVRP